MRPGRGAPTGQLLAQNLVQGRKPSLPSSTDERDQLLERSETSATDVEFGEGGRLDGGVELKLQAWP